MKEMNVKIRKGDGRDWVGPTECGAQRSPRPAGGAQRSAGPAWLIWAAACGACGWLAGCSSTPSRLEQKFFDISTNAVPRVVVVTNFVPVTNVVERVVVRTNVVDEGRVEVVRLTNRVEVVEVRTNAVTVTNLVPVYSYAPNTNAAAAGAIAGSVAAPFGWGGVVGTLVGGLFAAWAGYRNRQSAAAAAGAAVAQAQAEQVAGVLAQVIETGRALLQTTPQGAALDDQWKSWMIAHQLETDTIQDVVRLLGTVVDSASAQRVAGQLVQLVEERKTAAAGGAR